MSRSRSSPDPYDYTAGFVASSIVWGSTSGTIPTQLGTAPKTQPVTRSASTGRPAAP